MALARYHDAHRKEKGKAALDVVNLNLGCHSAIEGSQTWNCARTGHHSCGSARAWPWADNSVDSVLAFHILEHLPDKIFTMNELWRVLNPGATIALPTTEGAGAWQDPKHVSFWNRRARV